MYIHWVLKLLAQGLDFSLLFDQLSLQLMNLRLIIRDFGSFSLECNKSVSELVNLEFQHFDIIASLPILHSPFVQRTLLNLDFLIQQC